MKELIACCGLDCEQCDARIATLSQDDSLRAATAKKWRVLYNAPLITAESIQCTGCRMPGVKFTHCEDSCAIRKCVSSKGFKTCGECTEVNACETVGFLHKAVPEARMNLGL